MNNRIHFTTIAVLFTLLQFSQIPAIQYTPVDIQDDYSDCALLLPNHDEAVTHLIQSEFGGGATCITYDDVNQAVTDARRRIDIPTVEDGWKSEEVATIGQLLLDVSQHLAKKYNLNVEDIELGLPQIDTMKTAVADICPAFLSSITCRAGKYRRQDGLCNNVQHPTWGAINTPFTRLLPPQFADHISAARISVTGHELPNSRIVSSTIHTDEGYHDHAGTLMTVAWGQFLDHDFTLTGTPLDPSNRNEPEECCNRPSHLKNPYCMEIDVPEGDYFYGKYDVKCQDFVRAFPAVQPDCRLGSRTPFNTLTGVIDGNTVYGVTDELSRQLRTGHGGLLKMNPAFESLGLKELLPMKTDIPDEGCVRTNGSQFCFLAGEIRVNEQLILTCIHTLMAREHNRIALNLAQINPHWDDEILYQETKRIVVAEIQHITFNEFLPLILGKDITEKYGIELRPEGYWDGYNPDVNPGIIDAFAAAAYRFGHSLLPSAVERWSKFHRFIASKRLSELIRRPYDLYRAGVIDEYFMGLLNQVAQAMDDSVTQEVTNNLFKKTGNQFGLDLVSFNIQRGRDFGLPGYMHFRKHCGLKTADTFYEMVNMMPNSTIYRYMTIFEHPWDIDLWSGGVAELPLPGGLVGPTFACIIATQMNVLRSGDRFWYELPNQPSSFTPAQLQEIRKIKLSRIVCDNTDLLDTVQIHSMVLPDHDINPRVPCKSLILPSLDLDNWADRPQPVFKDTLSTNIIRNNASSPSSVYSYHMKTVAVIGASPTINVNELLTNDQMLSAPLPDQDYHRSKRDTNHIPPPPSLLDTAATSDISDRPQYKRPLNYHIPHRRPTMTQAIIKEQAGLRSRSAKDEPDTENFFSKNVPIYNGMSSSRNNIRRGFRPYPKLFSPQKDKEEEEEEEVDEEKEQPMSVEEVDPDPESQFEEVPMVVNQFGKQKVMSEPYFKAAPVPAPAPAPTPYRSFKYPTSHPPSHYSEYNPYTSHSSFQNEGHLSNFKRPSDYGLEQFSRAPSGSFSQPPKYGTSHQFNSLADDRPRYYKHLKPIRPQQASFEGDYFQSYEGPQAASFRSHHLPAESRRPTGNDEYRTSIPLTIEEYHRLHNNGNDKRYKSLPSIPLGSRVGNGRHTFFGRAAKKPKKPKNDEKDEEENDEKEDEDDKEKDDDDFSSKSFVSMNFKNLNLNDGFSIKHLIAPSKTRFRKPSYGSSSHQRFKIDDRGDSSESFPNVAPADNPQFQDPNVIKDFVNSMFQNDKSKESEQMSPDRKFNSPYNPNFGERVKGSNSRQTENVLWRRKSNLPSERNSDFKSSIFNRDKDANILDKLSKDLNIRQSKRDIFEQNATETTDSWTLATLVDGEAMAKEQENEEEYVTTAVPMDGYS